MNKIDLVAKMILNEEAKEIDKKFLTDSFDNHPQIYHNGKPVKVVSVIDPEETPIEKSTLTISAGELKKVRNIRKI